MTDSPLNDPRFPHRPQHPDFWRLSEIVLRHDAVSQDELAMILLLGEHLDNESLEYMALQRGLVAAQRLGLNREGAVMIGTAWMTGVLAGIEFQKKGGHRSE